MSTGALQLSPLDADRTRSWSRRCWRQHARGDRLAAARPSCSPTGTAAFARFTRVLPTEYDRMRSALAQAEADGLDVHAPGVWDQILEVSRG